MSAGQPPMRVFGFAILPRSIGPAIQELQTSMPAWRTTARNSNGFTMNATHNNMAAGARLSAASSRSFSTAATFATALPVSGAVRVAASTCSRSHANADISAPRVTRRESFSLPSASSKKSSKKSPSASTSSRSPRCSASSSSTTASFSAS